MQINTFRIILDIILDGYSAIVCAIIAASLIFGNKNKAKLNPWFMITLYSNIAMSLSDILTVVCEGTARPWFRTVFPIAMFLYFLLSFILLIAIILFLINFVGNNIIGHVYSIVPPTVLFVFLAFLVLTPATGAYYTIDENNYYNRGDYYYIQIILEVILILQTFILLFVKRQNVAKGKLVPVIVMLFIPIIAQIIQLYNYGISIINTGFTLTCIIIFANFNSSITSKPVNNGSKIKRNKKNKLQDHTISSLTNMMAISEKENSYHIARVCQYVELIAEQAKQKKYYEDELTDSFISKLRSAALVYDVGKLVVTDGVLKKTEPLTEEEKEEIRNHVPLGEKILKSVFEEYDDKEFVKIAEEVVMCHHEKWNGKGYPNGLSEREIPLSARIISIADVFDALVAPRVYKSSISYEEAYVIMNENSGVAFDPLLIEAFLSDKKKIQLINEKNKVKGDKKN